MKTSPPTSPSAAPSFPPTLPLSQVPPDRRPGGHGRRRRRRSLVGTIGALLVAVGVVLAGLGLLGRDAGLPGLSTAPAGTSAPAGDASSGTTPADEDAASRDLPFDEDDPRQEDSTIDPFDDDHPAIAGLEPDLRAALQEAARGAQAAGVEVWVTSGWRSPAYQQRLLDRAVDRYGSLAEARRFVNTPEESTHVTGQGVDVGPTNAADWFVRKGAAYGLCQTYANEMWHFELAVTPGEPCPTPLPDASR